MTVMLKFRGRAMSTKLLDELGIVMPVFGGKNFTPPVLSCDYIDCL